MTASVSIVMTAYKREAQLDATLASIFAQNYPSLEVIVVEDGQGGHEEICKRWPVRFFRRANRPDLPYSNPAIPNNIGLRRATGEIVILQNAECKHVSQNTIAELTAPVVADCTVSTFGAVLALNRDGSPGSWYCHPEYNPRPLFFCQALRREYIERLRGFDEEFVYYGYDDDDFARRLAFIGLKFVFTQVRIHHQWHGYNENSHLNLDTNQELFNAKSVDMGAGRIGPERNLGREWGSLDS